MKLSKGNISYRRWTGSTSKTPPAVPSSQAQHPSPARGKVLHFHLGGIFALKPSAPAGASEGFSQRRSFSISHILNPLHQGLLLCKSTLGKALILLQDFFSSHFIHTTPYMVFYPLSTLTSLPFLSLEIRLEQRNCIPSPAGHLAKVDPEEQNPAIDFQSFS